MRRSTLLVALIAIGCSSTPRSPSPAAQSTSDDSWSRARWEDRHDTMTFAVLPRMAKLFQKHRHSPDPDLACTSCHGTDAEAVAYAMPHGLPPLDPARLPLDTEMGRFMKDEVAPAMADLLDKPSYGCFGCHPKVGAR